MRHKLLPPTPLFSKGSHVNRISCTQLLKKVHGSFPPRQSYFLLHQSKKKWTANVLGREGECRGWIEVTFWEKGTPTTCDAATSTMSPPLQPCACLCCLAFRGGPHLLTWSLIAKQGWCWMLPGLLCGVPPWATTPLAGGAAGAARGAQQPQEYGPN